MYNRYIPQPDGTYRRRQVQEPVRPPQSPKENRQPSQIPPQIAEEPRSEQQPAKQEAHFRSGRPKPQPDKSYSRRPVSQKNPPKKEETSLTDFFHKLLPKDFDTGDLLIVLLLLLMSGDNQEDQNSALLTLAIYMFM